MLKQNLHDIDLYARKSLDALERGVEVVPDWIHHKIAAARTHMKDVGHFMRHEVRMGRRYGGGKDGICRGSLDNISEYAKLTSKSLQKGGGQVPEWVHSKVAVAADYMDCVGHYLESRAKSGDRVYGQTIDYDERGPAGVGGVAWVAPPERPSLAPSTAPVQERGLTPSGRPRHVQPRGVDRGRKFGVPGFSAGAPGWAGAGGVAQAPGPGCGRGGGGGKGNAPAHAYGSLGYASMGDGSMDLATDGGGARRYSMTWRYDDDEMDPRRRHRSKHQRKRMGIRR